MHFPTEQKDYSNKLALLYINALKEYSRRVNYHNLRIIVTECYEYNICVQRDIEEVIRSHMILLIKICEKSCKFQNWFKERRKSFFLDGEN